jgi:hypothetical protein
VRIYNRALSAGEIQALYGEGRPGIGLSAVEFVFVAPEGGPNPSDQILTITNNGAGTLNWRVTEDCNWLSAEPNSGSSTGEIDSAVLNVDVTGLAGGIYNCQLTVSDPCAMNSPQMVTVTVHIAAGLQLHVPSQYATIQAAIDAAVDGDTVIVAPGTYTGDGNRDIDLLGKAVTVRSVEPNDPEIVGSTVIDCNGTEVRPHCGFWFKSGEGNDSIVAGFTIINGFGPHILDGLYWYTSGGAILAEGSSPTIQNCLIENNQAKRGGGLCFYGGNPIVSNCTVRGNKTVHVPPVDRCEGGGIHLKNATVTIRNCMVVSNSADCYAGWGGGVSCNRGTALIDHCTIADNSSRTPYGGVCDFQGSVTMTNSIVWGNRPGGMGPRSYRVSYSAYPGGYPGRGNIGADPLFADPGRGDYHLAAASPCVDAGDPNYVGAPAATDIDGDPRVVNGRVDMGADEFTTMGPLIWVSTAEFEFTAQMGGPNPEAQVLGIRNIGNDTLSWHVTKGCSWLEVAPASGQSTGDVNEVTVTVDVTGLLAGLYYCQFTVSDPCAINSPQMVDVYLTISGPAIGLSSQQFAFYAEPNGPNPTPQILSISNAGSGMLNWQITEDCNWLWVTPTSGQSTGEPDQVAVIVEIDGLPAGQYNCDLTVSDPNAVNIPRTVVVTLIVRIARQLLVPSQYPTIQAAIDDAIGLDTVIIEPGTYRGAGNKNLDFKGKAITVRSMDPNDPCVVAATVIDCQNSGRGFYFHSDEGPDSIVAGITTKRGSVKGGGMYFTASSPTIHRCNIVDNTVCGQHDRDWNGLPAYGGGIYCDSSCSPRFEGCVIKDNRAQGGHGSNLDAGDGGDAEGGGIWATHAEIRNCIIAGNESIGGRGGSWYTGAPDPGCWPGAGGVGYGGGLYCEGDCTIVNSTIVNNIASGGTNGCEGGLRPSRGGGVAGGTAVITDCIVWGNSALYDPQVSGIPSVTYSDVQGGYSGVGNIDADPCFVSGPEGDYYLAQIAAWQAVDSLCVDAGSDTAAVLDMDQCTTRIDEVADEGIVDMGYHYGNCGPAAIPGDIDGDGDVDGDDYALFAAGWYCREPNMIAKGTAMVDGDFSEWSEDVGWTDLEQVYYGSPNDVEQARFALRWDADANKVYAAVVVQDTDHVFSDERIAWDASDRIEIYSQGDAEGGRGWTGTYDVAQQYIVGPNTAGGAWATWGGGEPLDVNVGLEYAVAVDGDQIMYEVGVRMFDNYGVFSGGDTIITDLTAGHTVGFDVVVNTRWGAEGFGMLCENLMMGKYNDADKFGRYTLIEESGGPFCQDPACDLDGNGVCNFADLWILLEQWLAGK